MEICFKKDVKRFTVIALIALLLLTLYGYRLYFPLEVYYDEVYHVKRASQLAVEHQFNSNVTIHPPLWHFVSACCISLLGDCSWVWRIPSMVCGLLVLFLVYLLTERIFKNYFIALLALFLFTFDCMSITQARIGMLNSMMLMFMLASMYFFLQSVLFEKWSRRKSFLLAGMFLGLGMATRIVASYQMIIYGIITGAHLIKSRKNFWITIKDAFLYLIIVPVVIYFGVYLSIIIFNGNSWSDFWSHLHYSFRGFALKEGHDYGSSWWSWPLIIRPIWYFFAIQKETGEVNGILCMGNQAIFWIIPLSMGYVMWKFIQKREWSYGLILLGFFGQWLPWAFIDRVKFFHFFYTAMPFVCMSIAVFLFRIWHMNKWGKVAVVAYLVLVTSLYIYWYPLLTGYPVTLRYYMHHMWFRSWI